MIPISGIYQIRNIINGKIYIGSAAGKGFNNRWNTHIKQLNDNNHHSSKLQHAWNKYGKQNFIFEVIEELKFPQNYPKGLIKEYVLGREQYYLDTILFADQKDSRFNKLGYNICRIAGNTLGFKHSKKTIKIISEKRAKQPPWNKGKSFDEKSRINMSNAHATLNIEQNVSNILTGRAYKYFYKNISNDIKQKIKLRKYLPRKITKEIIDKVIEMSNIGFSYRSIAKILKIGIQTILKIKKQKRGLL